MTSKTPNIPDDQLKELKQLFKFTIRRRRRRKILRIFDSGTLDVPSSNTH